MKKRSSSGNSLDSRDEQFKSLEKQIERFSNSMDRGFLTVGNAFQKIGDRIDRFDHQFNQMEGRLIEIWKVVNRIEETILKDHAHRIERLETQLESLKR